MRGNSLSQISQWDKAQFVPLYGIKTPLPITKIFVTVYYVRESTHCTKLDANPPMGSAAANRWNITEIFLIYTFFSETHLQVRPQTVDWVGLLRMDKFVVCAYQTYLKLPPAFVIYSFISTMFSAFLCNLKLCIFFIAVFRPIFCTVIAAYLV